MSSVRIIEEFIYDLERTINEKRLDRLRWIKVSPRVFDDLLRDPYFRDRLRGYTPLHDLDDHGHHRIKIRGVTVMPDKIFSREDAVAWESEESCGCCLMRLRSMDYGRRYNPDELPSVDEVVPYSRTIEPRPTKISRSFLEELKEI